MALSATCFENAAVNYSLRLIHRKVYHSEFDLLFESWSWMWQKSLSNVLDLDSFTAILSNMNLVSDFVRLGIFVLR